MVDSQIVSDLRVVIGEIEDRLKAAGLKCSEFDLRSEDVAPWLVALRFIEERLTGGEEAPATRACYVCGKPTVWNEALVGYICSHPEGEA